MAGEIEKKPKAKPKVKAAPSQGESQEVLDAMKAANDAVVAAVQAMAIK